MLKRLLSRLRHPSKLGLGIAGAAVIASIVGSLVSVLDVGGHVKRAVSAPTAPVRFTLNFDQGVNNDGWDLVVPDPRRAAAAFTHIDGCGSLMAAARRAGGADVETTYLQLFAVGRSSDTVVLTGMRARMLQRQQRLTGALVSCPAGGDIDPIRLTFNLDGDGVAERVAGNWDQPRVVGLYFAHGHAVSVAKGEPVSFSMSFVTKRHYVVWKLEVTALINGRLHLPARQPRRALQDHREPRQVRPANTAAPTRRNTRGSGMRTRRDSSRRTGAKRGACALPC